MITVIITHYMWPNASPKVSRHRTKHQSVAIERAVKKHYGENHRFEKDRTSGLSTARRTYGGIWRDYPNMGPTIGRGSVHVETQED